MTRASIEIHLDLNNKVLNQIKLQRLYKAGEATKHAKQVESKTRQHKGDVDKKLVREKKFRLLGVVFNTVLCINSTEYCITPHYSNNCH